MLMGCARRTSETMQIIPSDTAEITLSEGRDGRTFAGKRLKHLGAS